MAGRIGSFWSRQVDPVTKDRVRLLADTSGLAGQLQRLDVLTAAATGCGPVLVEDTSFSFIDGDFAHVGADFEAYTRLTAPDGFGESLVFVRRDPSDVGYSDSSVPRPHVLSTLTAEFVATVTAADALPVTSDWYLLPVPYGLTPIIIESRLSGVSLVSGIDFTAHDGYIALRDNPAEVLPCGRVAVQLALKDVDQPDSFVFEAPLPRHGSTRLAEYAKRSQSVKSFHAAAAEYCGMFVLREADLVLYKRVVGASTVYVLASAGVVSISYPHTPLVVGKAYPDGHVIASRLQFLTVRADGAGILTDSSRVMGGVVNLDGVQPVKGLSWVPGAPVLVDYTDVGPGGAHARIHLNGSDAARESLWAVQKSHELATGHYLSEALGVGPTPLPASVYIDFGAFLENFYADRFVMVITDDQLPPAMATKLATFLREHRPSGCVILTETVPTVIP